MKATIYARISMDKSGDGLGVARQVQACRELAKSLPATVVSVYQDNDRSAFSGKARPDYEAMLSAATRGEFDVILCWATDRLYRRMSDLIHLTEVLRGTGVTVATVQGGDVDLSTADGILKAQIMGSVSEHESRRKGERVAARAQQRAEAGISTSAVRPFGWERNGGGRFRPHPTESVYVMEAYERFLRGESLSSIARWLNGQGLVGPRGAAFTQARVSHLLRLPRHGGYVHHRGAVVPTTSQDGQIVSPEVWHQAQRILREPDRKKKGPPVVSWLTGRMTCSKCLGPVRPSSNQGRNGTRYKTYACVKNHVSWPREALETAVEEHLTAWADTHWNVITELAHEEAAAAAVGGVSPTVEQELAEARATLERLAAELEGGHITAEIYMAAANALDIPGKEARLTPRTRPTELTAMIDAGNFSTYFAKANLIQKRNALNILDVSITVEPKRTGSVWLNVTPFPGNELGDGPGRR